MKKLFAAVVFVCLVTTVALAVSFTPQKGYFLPTVNGDPNVWGGYLNQTTAIIDSNMGGQATVNVAGSANVTATTSQSQQLVQKLTGTLTGNINYILPAVGSFYIISNQTSGAYTVTVLTSAAGSTGTVVPQGQSLHVYSDATNIYPANGTQGNFGGTPVGSGMQFWGTSAPSGWILAYGQSLGRSTCASLFAVVGTTYGSVDGTHFTAPDMRGRTAIAKDDMGGTAANRITAGVSGITGTTLGSAGGSQNAQADTITTTLSGSVTASSSSNSTVTDPGHSHTVSNIMGTSASDRNTSFSGGFGAETATTSTATTGITVATTTSTTISNTLAASSTSSLTGASQNVQPGIIANYIVNAGGSCS